jgi:hypothetical protein
MEATQAIRHDPEVDNASVGFVFIAPFFQEPITYY